MSTSNYLLYGLSVLFLISISLPMQAQELYTLPEGTVTRWTSFENPTGKKGAGGTENEGAKGHAFENVKAGDTITLLDMEGAGIIKRIWLTIIDRSREMLRSMRIDMYWDGAEKPAVSAPLGDFFGIGLGRRVAFESALFTDPEGKSFNSYVPMPFKKGARITVTNESDTDLRMFFYDINLVKVDQHEEDILYFHAYWSRDLKTELRKDFEILPRIEGSGRFLGTNIGVLTNPAYRNSLWGEGEIKMYINDDGKYPTLIGTGTEDYIGTGWGQGTFDYDYQGSPIANPEEGAFAFYRYHIPDPVYFRNDIRVTLQQIGGAPTDTVRAFDKEGAPLIPISTDNDSGFVRLLEMSPVPNLHDPGFPMGWTNFYRRDDVSSTAYFYLRKPTTDLPTLAPVEKRTAKLKEGEK